MERLFQIRNDVLRILDADAEAEKTTVEFQGSHKPVVRVAVCIQPECQHSAEPIGHLPLCDFNSPDKAATPLASTTQSSPPSRDLSFS